MGAKHLPGANAVAQAQEDVTNAFDRKAGETFYAMTPNGQRLAAAPNDPIALEQAPEVQRRANEIAGPSIRKGAAVAVTAATVVYGAVLAEGELGGAAASETRTTAVASKNTETGAGAAGGGRRFFRGAKPGQTPNFTPRPSEFKVDPVTGTVKPTHGVSVFDNAESVSSKGFVPHEVDQTTVPRTLRIKQRGEDPAHYEIMPVEGANLTPEQFTTACQGIGCKR